MSKRSRAQYEADLQAQQSPFVAFGTPLPPLDSEVRDDGSYLPAWKQEVRDEKGRRRLHGAFTGGWSAGYYNTVGSKEGWTPSAFVSSRTNRRKNDANAPLHRPEDYMDEEDLADAEEARKLQTTDAFAGLGLTADSVDLGGGSGGGGLAGLFRVQGETMGTKLLKKMGWRDGQGIGPKVRRAARLDVGGAFKKSAAAVAAATYLFAPENTVVVKLVKKSDRKGLGYKGEARLSSRRLGRSDSGGSDGGSDDDGNNRRGSDGDRHGFGGLFGRRSAQTASAKGKKDRKGPSVASGIGVGVLNDTGTDDEEDPYDMGPRLSFNRTIGGDTKKKKKKAKKPSTDADNGADADVDGDGGDTAGSKARLVLFSRRPALLADRASTLGRSSSSDNSSSGRRRCHDGRPPLAGFVLGREADALTSEISSTTATSKYPPPQIPAGWKSSMQQQQQQEQDVTPLAPAAGAAAPWSGGHEGYVSTADVARASTLDPKARAAVLGESQLPGKSVFDFLSPEARARIAAATGRSDLPQARSEVPAEYALSDAQKREQLLREVPAVDKATAVAAITRGARGGGPYQDNEAKQSRYRAYLEYHAGITRELPPKPAKWTDDDWLRECHEFYNCARIFKPMSGIMASRFTTSSVAPSPAPARTSANGAGGPAGQNLITRPAAPAPASAPATPSRPKDPAEEAAMMGMYGTMTRSTQEFYPTRLLCKRMGVRPPAIVQPDHADAATDSKWPSSAPSFGQRSSSRAAYADAIASSVSAGGNGRAEDTRADTNGSSRSGGGSGGGGSSGEPTINAPPAKAVVQADRNEALEGQRAGDDVFRAVFGDSDDDDDDDS